MSSSVATPQPTGSRSDDDDFLLEAVDQRLRGLLLDAELEDPAVIAQRLQMIFEVGELRQELREHLFYERLDVLALIQESLDELRTCETPEALIEAAPGELCRSCGFSRALISRVHGSRWIPEVLETVPGMDPDAERVAEYTDPAEIPLEHLLPEAELVRRRMPALITDPVADPLARGGMLLVDRTAPYVAAPIMPTGRVIGFLHADRIGQDEPVTLQDRDNLWTFAEQFGYVYERAVLAERLDAQRDHLRKTFSDADEVVEQLCGRRVELARKEQAPAASARSPAALFRPPESRLDGLLTRREREVVELMTSGATNTRIAEQLVISEGTVKSHVKHILRKLRAANRAEAVARYLQIMLREQEDTCRQ